MLTILPLFFTGFPAQTPKEKAESARYAFHTATWGYLSTLGKQLLPTAEVASFSDGTPGNSTGRLWFYMMDRSVEEEDSYAAAITVSEASYNATCGFAGSKLDPEDPRCAKITIAGTMMKSTGDDIATGKSALFATHPQMKRWPAGHGFAVFELSITDVWMIDFYGGGGSVDLELYRTVEPKHSVPSWPPHGALLAAEPAPEGAPRLSWVPPPATQPAARARWLVYNSMWTAVSTVSVRLQGRPWANVRSMADGVGTNSTGRPVLYLPTPDPTSVDIAADAHCAISFSEAALPERLASTGTCGGMDSEDPTCARLVLSGTLRALTTKAEIARAEADLGARHPLAPWLAQGGAHTGGKYFTLDIASLSFLDNYGGFAKLTVEEYLGAKPPF